MRVDPAAAGAPVSYDPEASPDREHTGGWWVRVRLRLKLGVRRERVRFGKRWGKRANRASH